MATGRKTGGVNFVKGDPKINRNGRPKMSEELKATKILTLEELRKVFENYILNSAKHTLTESELEKLKEDGEITTLEAILLRGLTRDMSRGETKVLDSMLDRLGIRAKDGMFDFGNKTIEFIITDAKNDEE